MPQRIFSLEIDEGELRAGMGDTKAKMTQLIKEYTNFLASFRDTKAVGFKRQCQYRLAMLRAEAAESRADQLEAIRALEQFFQAMHQRVDLAPSLGDHPGAVALDDLRRQGQQWHRRLEALVRRSAGEKFARLAWPW